MYLKYCSLLKKYNKLLADYHKLLKAIDEDFWGDDVNENYF